MKTSSEYNKEYYQKNKERLLAKSNDRYAKNKEDIDNYRKNWYLKNKDKQKETRSFWYQKNKHLVSSYVSKRRALKLSRIPKWSSEDDCWLIDEIYDLAKMRTKLTGVQFEVDHIIPLQGKTVSGFHIPSNLQVITAVENKMKSNYWKGN